MFRVLSNQMIVPNIHQLTVEAPEVAREFQPGQFVIVRAEDEGERIPLSVSDWDVKQGTLTILFMIVGSTTDRLSSVPAEASLPTVVGPLGNPTEIEDFGTVLCVGGCYGIGSIYPIARALKARGNRVITVLESRSNYLLYWEDKLKSVSDQLYFITRDGTKGMRGHVGRLQEVLARESTPVNRIIVNGCTFVSKRVADFSRPLGTKTIVSLNPIMIDGTGMCGVCRLTVGNSRKFACVDGPDFDAAEVDWHELMLRRRQYMAEEVVPFHSSRCEERRHA
jgi:ferredoxin--NADP+ reductase